MISHLAIFGHPVAHSLSPQIHKQFAAQFACEISYEKILAPQDGFREAVLNFINKEKSCNSTVVGFNVTAPFKIEAFKMVDTYSDRAQQAGVVNTVKVQHGKLFGDNTDGVGFLNDLRAKNIEIKNKCIVMIGAGGAARGILPVLVNEQPSQVIILNRDVQKAKMLALSLQGYAGDLNIDARSFTDIRDDNFFSHASLLIDATSDFDVAQQTLKDQTLQKDVVIYDLKYSREGSTPLTRWANQQGIKACDGLGMLIEQAAEAFYLWFGLKPDTRKIVLR